MCRMLSRVIFHDSITSASHGSDWRRVLSFSAIALLLYITNKETLIPIELDKKDCQLKDIELLLI